LTCVKTYISVVFAEFARLFYINTAAFEVTCKMQS